MRCFRRSLVLLVFLFMFLVVPRCVFAVNGVKVEAEAAIADAEGMVVDCYGVLVEAERAGADVSGLLVRLNEAGMLLSKAYLAYGAGNFSYAKDFAVWCKGNLTGFVGEAEALKEAAMQASYWDFMVNFVGSGVGAVCVVVCGFTVWTFLRKQENLKEKA